ncbi:uncharacterized protein LOC113203962 [Frankliniella occidentalis]|uniref:Uncharacterized protein LOC113203962 n=1 Tax=Frankliniella occidentalis TaxID=133901 RepID=A0A9C6U749_FRAOC|nr:uncharacterized protein LOC113203962 [Frankliniella occidentalis]
MLRNMINNIEVSVPNDTNQNDDMLDDSFDPMRDDWENININSYEHGPGANLDVNLQCPRHRDKNNQVVYKIMVNRIPPGLTRVGLENLFLNFGTPNVLKCQEQASDKLNFALISYNTLAEAIRAIRFFDTTTLFNQMKVGFARSDEENVRIQRKRQEEERQFANMVQQRNNNYQPALRQDRSPGKTNRPLLRMLGRGFNRGRFILKATKEASDRKAGLQNCAWSNGVPDFRDSSGMLYDPKSYRYNTTNKVLQSIVVTAGGNSLRKVAMGRGFVPPENSTVDLNHDKPLFGVIGTDIQVPIQPCVACGAETPQKCSQCGAPYCSVQCQKVDFRRHRPMCTPKESIDIILEPNLQNTVRSAPLCQNNNPVEASTTINTQRFWGKPEKNVLSLLQTGTDSIFSINSTSDGKYHGTLSCGPIFEFAQNLFVDLPDEMKKSFYNSLLWPSMGMLVAVRFEDSIWRGYIINIPCLGSSTKYTVALCDYGKIVTVDISDLLSLPSSYHTLPELAVTCEVVQAVALKDNLDLHIVSSCNSGATAKIMGENKSEIGIVSLSPWLPSCGDDLIPVSIEPPCMVVVTAYHNQGTIYVRPLGKNIQEQLFTLMQKVATINVTSQPIQRPPYKGEMVACRYKKDGNFYRAIVSEAASTNEYSVFFVDFGNVDVASALDMKPISQELKNHPCMVMPVSLKGVKQGPLSEDAIQLLNRISLKEQQFRLECPNTSVEGVELYYPDNKSLNHQLNELLMPEWELQMKKGAEPHKGEVFLIDGVPVLPLLKDGQRKGTTNVVVANIIFDGRIAVCPIDSPEVEHVLQTLAFQINEFCESTDPNMCYNPRIHEVCFAKYKDGLWYRAVNYETKTQTQSCQVFFIDYGNSEDVEFKDIRRMVPDFVSIPAIMSMCSIDGTPDDVTSETVKRISELVSVNQVYQVDVLETFASGDYKIHIPEISKQLMSEFRR